MQVSSSPRFLAFAIFTAFALVACTETPKTESSQDSFNPSGENFATEVVLSSKCGIVQNGELHSSLSASSAERVAVEVLDTDLVSVSGFVGENAGRPQLVKLQGITADGIPTRKSRSGIDRIARAAGYEAYFVRAGCDVTVEGVAGVIGQIFTKQGESINEVLLAEGEAVAKTDSCGGDVLNACYSAIVAPKEYSPQVINHFLWKPVSDNDNNLVIGIDEFVSVKVSGALTESHPATRFAGAPYVTFLRFSRPGCSYGNNVRVEFFDDQGLPLKTASGADHIIVPSGCRREELRF